MYYELEILDDLVLNKLKPSKRTTNSDLPFEEWLSIAHNENCKIKRKLLDNVLCQPDDSHIKVFIQNLQKRLTILGNVLFSHHDFSIDPLDNSCEESLTLVSVQRLTYLIIEDLLTFVMEHFGKFFDIDEQPTQNRTLSAIMQFSNNLKAIQSITDEPNKFLNVVISILSDSIRNPETITYRKISYIQQLTKELASFSNQVAEPDLSQFLIEKMLYLNFNAALFIKVVTKEYESVIDTLRLSNEKLEKLYWYYKNICQAQIHENLVYQPNHNHKSTKELLKHWIKEEISYLEKKLNLSTAVETEVVKKFNSGVRVHTTASVGELSYFLRILFDLGKFKNISVTDLTIFYANFYSTIKAENPSSENIRISFYEIEKRIKLRVRALIIRMLNQTLD